MPCSPPATDSASLPLRRERSEEVGYRQASWVRSTREWGKGGGKTRHRRLGAGLCFGGRDESGGKNVRRQRLGGLVSESRLRFGEFRERSREKRAVGGSRSRTGVGGSRSRTHGETHGWPWTATVPGHAAQGRSPTPAEAPDVGSPRLAPSPRPASRRAPTEGGPACRAGDPTCRIGAHGPSERQGSLSRVASRGPSLSPS